MLVKGQEHAVEGAFKEGAGFDLFDVFLTDNGIHFREDVGVFIEIVFLLVGLDLDTDLEKYEERAEYKADAESEQTSVGGRGAWPVIHECLLA